MERIIKTECKFEDTVVEIPITDEEYEIISMSIDYIHRNMPSDKSFSFGFEILERNGKFIQFSDPNSCFNLKTRSFINNTY